MAYGLIDPARLDGDALTRWYLRSPANIDQERQTAAAHRYDDFFGRTERRRTNGMERRSVHRSLKARSAIGGRGPLPPTLSIVLAVTAPIGLK